MDKKTVYFVMVHMCGGGAERNAALLIKIWIGRGLI